MRVSPPPPTRIEEVTDHLHGVDVVDPYRWLEDGESAETLAWVDTQNRRTRAALDAVPGRPELRRRMESLLRAASVSSPHLAGERVFTRERGGTRDQATLVVRSASDPTDPGRVLVDPASGGDDTLALDWFHPSPEGDLVAYGTSTAGDERSTLRLLQVDTGTHLDDAIPHTRAASVAWLPDGSAFA